ncbi:MAG: protein translocase subunit SecD [Pedosphaera sp.]|nr:protein translocase subunit SecD [Pedosphaera sp.]
MNRSHLWKLLFVLLVLGLSLNEMLPLGPRNLTDQFNETALLNRDPAINGIVKTARELDVKTPDRGYLNLLDAIGTNDATRYFPTNYILRAGVRNPNVALLARLQREAAGQVKLGLDLQGGLQFLMKMDSERVETNGPVSAMQRTFMLEQAVEILRRRVDRFGVAEPVLQIVGDDRILVQLSGLNESQTDEARATIAKAAFLEFRMVDPNQADHLPPTGVIPPGYEMKFMRRVDHETEQERPVPVIVKKTAERGFTGSLISHAMSTLNSMTGAPEINFSLTSEGARIFGEITTENVGKAFATILDGEVVSVATIREPIRDGSCRISGSFTEKEAHELASALENPLKAPLQPISSGVVGPSLGADNIRSGIRASIFGTIAVAIFMLGYYLLAGVVADIALMLNIVILLGVMCSIDVTLTLPGIAGIVLTIGMAVDANVLIYERMREEFAAGKSVRGSVAAGYDKAFGTILDSNLTTMISSVLLIIFGTGTVKGFGTTLTIGLMVSMFTSLFVTRLIFDFLLAKGWLKSLRMMNLVRGAKIDFMRLAKPAFILSWLVILIGCAYGAYRGKNMLSIDFAGGDSLTLAYKNQVEIEKLRAAVTELKLGDPRIEYQKENDRASVRIIVKEVGSGEEGSAGKLKQALTSRFPEAGFTQIGLEHFGPTVGAEIMRSAVVAILLSLFGILVYVAFRYEFSFAVGAVVAVIHDVLMTIGLYCLTGLWSEGRQFNATFVAAVLTIIGFSINDTIVIFDRIREDLKLGVRGSFREILNQALNQTLSRTVITSGTVFIATLSLYLFGGGAINDFAFTFLAGIVTGTYSSIYIASALVLWWHKGQRPNLGGNAVPISGQKTIEPVGQRA